MSPTDAKPVADTNIAEYGLERILAKAAAIDVYLAQEGPMNPVTVEQIRRESGFMAIKAVRENQCIWWTNASCPGRPLRLMRGIGRVAAILYPDRFGPDTRSSITSSAGCSEPAREVSTCPINKVRCTASASVPATPSS